MTLPLTVETLRAAYDYMVTTPPFDKWNLPDSEDIVFKVAKDPHNYAWHDKKRGKRHVVAVSRARVGHTMTLMESMAHEIIHVHEANVKGLPRSGGHSKAFWKWAAQVCRAHGFDLKRF